MAATWVVGRGSSDIILKGHHLRTIPTKFGPNWPSRFRGEDFINVFPIGSYGNTMSAGGSHLGLRAGSSDTILKKGPPKDYFLKFGHNWPSSFRREVF